MKVYIAARFEDIAWARVVRDTLRRHGVDVVSGWLDEDAAKTFDVITADGEEAAARQFAARDLAELDEAAVLVHVQPLAKPTTGGNHVEFGYALAKGKLICSLGLPPQPRTNVFHYLPDVHWFGNADALAKFLAAEQASRWKVPEDDKPAAPPADESVCAEADRLVSGDRGAAYGRPIDDFSKTAVLWGPILGVRVEPEQVALCMAMVKVSRELNKHKRDNLTDLCGYTKCLDMVVADRAAREADGQYMNGHTGKWEGGDTFRWVGGMSLAPFADAAHDLCLRTESTESTVTLRERDETADLLENAGA